MFFSFFKTFLTFTVAGQLLTLSRFTFSIITPPQTTKMTLSILLFFLLAATIQAVQINFSSHPSRVSNDNYWMIKDTAQAHYESIIDDILSQHNEGILTELSHIIKDPQQMYSIMKPQADLLYGTGHAIEGKKTEVNQSQLFTK